jgi:hypothetical protein
MLSDERPVLYSSVAVQVFAFVLGPLFGGVMAYHNLKDLGRPQPASKLLWSSLYFTAIVFAVGSLANNSLISTGLNLAGGLWVGRQYQQLVPDANQYPRKSIQKPLVISLLISLPIAALALLPRYL